jgi:parvulin-like peptidyl-prolyl isomerase
LPRKRAILIALLPSLLAAAPAPITAPAPAPANDPVIAHLNNINITRSQIVRPLIEGYGLNVLINTATLEYAKSDAATKNIAVSADDVEKEREVTLSKLFGDAKKEDYPQLLEQFLTQQRISRPEFDIWIETNAYLRKIAEPEVKRSITEDRLQEAFKAQYGEKVEIRHIQCANLQEIAEAKRRIAAGESFEHVAQTMSRNIRTAPLGGLMPPFSRFADYPEVFKDTAFSLNPGEVSDTVEAGGIYHIIKLERKIEPKAIKFNDVKESLREDLADRLTQSAIKNLRQQAVDVIGLQLKVDDPVLAKQYDARKTDNVVRGKKDAVDAMKRDDRRAADNAPPLMPEDLRPPAPKPGDSSPGASTVPSFVKPTTRP